LAAVAVCIEELALVLPVLLAGRSKLDFYVFEGLLEGERGELRVDLELGGARVDRLRGMSLRVLPLPATSRSRPSLLHSYERVALRFYAFDYERFLPIPALSFAIFLGSTFVWRGQEIL